MTRRRLLWAGLAIATISCAGCAMTGYSGTPCPPLVAYGRTFTARLADEVAALPEGTAIVAALSDYAVLREQVRRCRED